MTVPSRSRKKESAMFEQELEMEQQQSSVVPLILIIAMILAFVGVAGYYVMENRKVMPAVEASDLIAASLKSDGPAIFHFRTGMVVASVQDRPHDANYRLLEKAGLINIGKDKGRTTPVTLTAAGRKLLADIPGVKENKDPKDGTLEYVVPAAERKLAGTPKVTMLGIGRAKADFEWAWAPTQMGELLDASGPTVKSFNTWDRGTLIDKYGAKFYHAAPVKATMTFTKGDKGWQITAE
jgi:hypothetical protein